MRLFKFIIINTLLVFTAQSIIAQDSNIPSDSIGVFNNHSFEFKYPLYPKQQFKSWRLDTSGIYGPAIVLFPPAKTNSGNSCYITIGSQPQTSEPVSRDSMIRANLQFLPYSIEAFQLIAADSMEINGKEAFSLVYEGKQNNNFYRWWQTYIVYHSQLYAITYGATPAAFKEFEPVAQNLTNSFTILEE